VHKIAMCSMVFCAPVRHPRKVLQRSLAPTPSDLGSSRVYGATVETANVEKVSIIGAMRDER